MQQQMDKLNHCFLFKKKAVTTFDKNYIFLIKNYKWDQILPGFGGLETKPSNKSIIGAAPTRVVACPESEDGNASSSNDATGDLLSWMLDNTSGGDELLCTGGVSIDKRSSRTSVPVFEAWFVPEIAER